MNKELLEYENKAKYLGHVIHCTLSDDDDILNVRLSHCMLKPM